MNRAERRRLKKAQAKRAKEVLAIHEAELVPTDTTPQRHTQTPQANPKAEQKLLMEFQAFAGPIPPPAIRAQYEQVCPGAADRIIRQFEEQGRHRRVLEKQVVNYNIISASVGQVFGLILFLSTLGLGGFLIYHDKPVGGIVSIVSALGAGVWALLKAERLKKADLAAKAIQVRKR